MRDSILRVAFFVFLTLSATGETNSQTSWPRPIPARIHDGVNKDLTVMTLGDVHTNLADGVFDPVKDEVRLNDGTVKPNYYKGALGIKFFSPIDKSVFSLPPSGWCSWYFYFQEVSEEEIRNNARWISANLKEYGARYVQIDDGWQGAGHGLGENRDWTTIDKRFSGGMDKLAFDIKSMGLVPGIWLAPHGQSNASVIRNHPSVFLKKPDGTSAADTWEGKFLVDPSTAETQKYLAALFTTLSKWGYEYFKIDGQPIVIREFKAKKEFMKNQGVDSDELYRQTLNTIRGSIGHKRYLLGCWVVPLEGAGIMNGSRTGADVVLGWDGFKYAMRATTQYYFLHNIAWYNDPDVLVVRAPLPLEQARAWTTLVGLTGQALLTSDRLMDLSPDRVDLLRRVYPAVDIRPLDLFPSERNKHIWDLKVNHLGRNYDVVGLFNYDESKGNPLYISWKDLGLPAGKRVHVFDYWNKEYLGAWEQGISVDLAPASSRLLTLLAEEDHPQLISTSRHITQGWVDLISQKYDAKTNGYQGASHVIKNDPYEIRFVFPHQKNFALKRAVVTSRSGTLAATISNHQGWATIQFTPARSGEVTWRVEFEPAGSYHFPTREPGGLWAESAGPDGVNIRWSAGPQPAAGYQVYLNGALVGFTPANMFALRNLDPRASYTAEVKTVGQDSSTSEKSASLKFTPLESAARETSLTELEVLSITPGWRQPELNRTYTGKGLFVAGKHFAAGIGMPTKSDIEFELRQAFETLQGSVGIDDQQGNEGGAEFAVIGDGKELWTSGVIKKADGLKLLKVDVRGVRRLQLSVKNAANVNGRVHTDWLDMKVVK
ncbi:MAG TPA: NPCBM/NEW2 domain-containing protein [Pyrinomonadaceae bacterium]|nr:NPCBM/NEW2 domain-containing protein [Pyrinomonadaceae bacterium]